MGYICISGMRRSGTSLLMLALRQSGIPTLGYKYSMDKIPPEEKAVKGNPNGYWELGLITTQTGVTSDSNWIGMPGDLMKVMVECLYQSDPKMIDKVIMIFRDPAKVMKSLLKHNIIEELELFVMKNLYDVGDSLDFLQYHNIPTKIVIYEEVLANPLEEMTKICKFLGRGDPEIAASYVNPELNRSEKQKDKGIKAMNKVYAWAKRRDIKSIIQFKYYLRKKTAKLLKKYDKKITQSNDKSSMQHLQ